MKKTFLIFMICLLYYSSNGQNTKHTFQLGDKDFLLNHQPFQIISGEMHPARIPKEYWLHRIQMAKAMGCNTISMYIFWNYHETSEGVFDFTSENRNIKEFIKLAKNEEMWVIIRPGPYVCAEWELGGIPPYLLRTTDIKLRCMDSRYMAAVERYLSRLAKELKPSLITNGGNILMFQVENEYGSYGNDRNYVLKIKDIWEKNGINVPFFTGDGPTTFMLEVGTIQGCAVGLDSGSGFADFELAQKMNPNVPVFSSETYPGWLTHWGEKWVKPDTSNLLKEIKFLMDNKKSFNFYVIHGGTNFGYTAGANSGGKGYEPDVTSYDYDAPINEKGEATPKYFALRRLIASYLPKGKKLSPVPAPKPAIEINPIQMKYFTSVWNNLPHGISSVQPKTFEAMNQDYGFALYRTKLIGHKSGLLTVSEIHDYATVFLNGEYIGKLDRHEGIDTITIPQNDVKDPVLEILVEGMGRINFGQYLIDRKGITDRVTLNGMTLMNWEVFNLPMAENYITSLKNDSSGNQKQGKFFKGNFNLSETGDTYFDFTKYRKGIIWINGHNLGRYWNIGPQNRLFCPASWLNKGKNEIILFDLHQLIPETIDGKKSLE